MVETDLPSWLQYSIIALQVIAGIFFLYIAWPHIRQERWKEKFIDNKTARSLLIVFFVIFIFLYGLGALFDFLFPVEELR